MNQTALLNPTNFCSLSTLELANYANPTLAKTAFGGMESVIGIIKLEIEDYLEKFLKKYSVTVPAIASTLFSILVYKYTRQEQFKLRQYQIGSEIRHFDLGCNLGEEISFDNLLQSAKQLYRNTSYDRLSDLDLESVTTGVSYSMAYFESGMSDEYVNTLIQNHLNHSEMCLMVDSQTSAYIVYDQGAFDRHFMIELIRHFEILLNQIYRDDDLSLAALSLTSPEDLQTQHERTKSASRDYGKTPIYRHFEQQAQKYPDSIAIAFGKQEITYRELNAKANKLANYLIAQNVQPQDCVGVFIEPSPDILVAILAIHKINAVYVPIDTEYPLGRIKTIIEQVTPSVIIVKSDCQEIPLTSLTEIDSNFAAKTINLPELNLSKYNDENLDYACEIDGISHIFFTSGTTGTPKGVVSSHSNLIQYIFAAQDKYCFSKEDSFLSAARFTFSISLFMLLLPLVSGGRVNLITFGELLKPQLLAQAIAKSTFFHLNPSLLKVLLDYLEENNQDESRFSHVKHASSGGDMIPAEILNRLNQVFTQAEVYAIYGSSEVSCMGCTYYARKEQSLQQTLVGKPFNNVSVKVLDLYQRVVPVGVKGEIYFSGQGITQGYLDLPHLTEMKYVNLDGERYYRMGDIGRFDSHGNLQIFGRDDNQVQIRGMRIELGEIESCINLHSAVRNCVVIVKEDRLGNKQLIAYLISQGQSPTSQELRNFLNSTLPQYMIPAHFVAVTKFPLNHNGKIDRKALTEKELAPQQSEQDSIFPRNELEQKIAQIWHQVLGIDSVGIRENFFHIGGHSLLASQLLSELEEAFATTLPLAALFQLSTIEEQAVFFEQEANTNTWSCLAPIQPKGSKPPLFLFQGIGIYYPLSYYLGEDQPVYGLSIEMIDESEHWFSQIEEMVALYIEEIRKVQPHGPYYFGGLSFGGMIALEAAQQLQAQGEEVALLAMMDTWGPKAFTPYSKLKKLTIKAKKLRRLGFKYFLSQQDIVKQKLDRLAEKLGLGIKINQAKLALTQQDDHQSNNLNQVYIRARKNYVPQIYSGTLKVFRSMENEEMTEFGEIDSKLGWSDLATKGLDIIDIPGDHLGILKEPNVETLATELQRCIDEADRISISNQS